MEDRHFCPSAAIIELKGFRIDQGWAFTLESKGRLSLRSWRISVWLLVDKRKGISIKNARNLRVPK